MTAETTTGEPLSLNDLPMPEHRDEAWHILHDHGGLIELDNGFAATRPDIVETVMKNPEVFSSKEAFDSLGSPIPLVPIAFDPPEQTRYRRGALAPTSPGSKCGSCTRNGTGSSPTTGLPTGARRG
jgi:hypothetical protein